jgi:hypothetical protein
MQSRIEKSIESRARRIAQREGYRAIRSRWRVGSCDNHGEFMLVDSCANVPVAGFRYDMSADEIIDYFAG